MHGRGGAGEVVHLIALQKDGLDDVVADDLEVWLADVVLDVLLGPGEEVVQAHHVVSALHEVIDEVRAHETGAAGHQHAVDARHTGARLSLDQSFAVLIHRERVRSARSRATGVTRQFAEGRVQDDGRQQDSPRRSNVRPTTTCCVFLSSDYSPSPTRRAFVGCETTRDCSSFITHIAQYLPDVVPRPPCETPARWYRPTPSPPFATRARQRVRARPWCARTSPPGTSTRGYPKGEPRRPRKCCDTNERGMTRIGIVVVSTARVRDRRGKDMGANVGKNRTRRARVSPDSGCSFANGGPRCTVGVSGVSNLANMCPPPHRHR